MKNLQKLVSDFMSVLARADNFSVLAVVPGMCTGVEVTSSYDGFMVIIEFNDTVELRKIIIPASVFSDYEFFRQYIFDKTRRETPKE